MIHRLPTEILRIIFRHVDLVDVLSFLFLNRSWNGVMMDSDFIEKISIGHDVAQPGIAMSECMFDGMLRNRMLNGVTVIRVNAINVSDMEHKLRLVHTLRAVNLTIHCDEALNLRDFVNRCRITTRVKHLTLSCVTKRCIVLSNHDIMHILGVESLTIYIKDYHHFRDHGVLKLAPRTSRMCFSQDSVRT